MSSEPGSIIKARASVVNPYVATLTTTSCTCLSLTRCQTPVELLWSGIEWRRAAVTATDPSAPNGKNPCATSKRAWSPTSPVVVETPFTSSFIMCTVPKVACSSFRKLLNTVIRSPDPAEASTWDQIMKAHFDFYPTVFHYKAPELHNLSQTHPSFILGRSPYVRVLSGFLNKMVFDPNVKEPHDMYNFHDTNRALGRPIDKQFRATRESFTNFLRLLEKAGTVNINDHFMRAGLVCDGGRWPYEFYLRLEEMTEWFPCWEAALGLQGFTRNGWLTTAEGKKHDGVSNECWWKPPGVSCEDYFEKATAADGSAQPVTETFVAAEKHDEHDTKASEKWRKFYTQETGDLLHRLYKEDFDLWGYEREIFES